MTRRTLKESAIIKRLDKLEAETGNTPSAEQEAFYRAVATEPGNFFLEATAGSGKTTACMAGMRFLPPIAEGGFVRKPKILYLVFNSRMQEEAASRSDLPAGVEVKTTHSFGFQALRATVADGKHGLKPSARKVGDMVRTYMGKSVPWKQYRRIGGAVSKCVSWIKNQGMELDPNNAEEREYLTQLVRHNMDREPTDAELNTIIGYTYDVMEDIDKDLSTIDFDDMIYMPAVTYRASVQFPHYDWIFVDERQDLNPCQVELLATYACRHPKTRFVFVGDVCQSIYMWRGAAPNVNQLIREKLCGHWTIMPLSYTFRCPKNVVKQARGYQGMVEDQFVIKAPEDAPEGLVSAISEDEFFDEVRPGDMILCRNNAPLIRNCLSMIKRGISATVVGKDFGTSLFRLYCDQVEPIKEYGHNNYEALQIARKDALDRLTHPGDEQLAIDTADRYSALSALIPTQESTTSEIEEAIKNLFDNRQARITFSSIHRAKGLESDRVFLLPKNKPDGHPYVFGNGASREEMNCGFVAVTRAKQELYLVEPYQIDEPTPEAAEGH